MYTYLATFLVNSNSEHLELLFEKLPLDNIISNGNFLVELIETYSSFFANQYDLS